MCSAMPQKVRDKASKERSHQATEITEGYVPTYLVPPRLPAGCGKERIVLCLATCLKVEQRARFVGLDAR